MLVLWTQGVWELRLETSELRSSLAAAEKALRSAESAAAVKVSMLIPPAPHRLSSAECYDCCPFVLHKAVLVVQVLQCHVTKQPV